MRTEKYAMAWRVLSIDPAALRVEWALGSPMGVERGWGGVRQPGSRWEMKGSRLAHRDGLTRGGGSCQREGEFPLVNGWMRPLAFRHSGTNAWV